MGQQEEEVQSNHNALNLLERHVVANAIPIEHRGGQCVNYYRCYGAQSLAAGGAMHIAAELAAKLAAVPKAARKLT